MYAGMRVDAGDDALRGRTISYSLDPGDYIVRPMFQVSGSGGTFVLRVNVLTVEVAL
jgi:hypothetical protein